MNIAVIFAGGVGSRMGQTSVPKQFLEANGVPVIIHTLRKFENSKDIDYISIACKKQYISHLKKLLMKYKVKKVRWISEGGETGQLSIYHALNAVYEDDEIPKKSIVLIHDAVRPIIDEQLIFENIQNVRKNGNSITVCNAQETIFLSEDRKSIDSILNRDHAFMAKAPQCFYLDELYGAHKDAIKEKDINNWDSCSLMSKKGIDLSFVIGKNSNIKITTMEDFYIFETLLNKENL